ncbi:hypothetical protein ACFL0Z_01055 [Patescibacteria group bacterium]
MLYLVIGPSGVGKGELTKDAEKNLKNVYSEEMDELIRNSDRLLYYTGNRWEAFWDKTLECIKKLESKYPGDNKLCLVDIGAGSLKSSKALDYFKKHRDITISIIDSPEQAFEHAKLKKDTAWRNKTLKEYEDEEFSPERMKIYETAKPKHRFDIEKRNLPKATECFAEWVDSTLKGNTSPNVSHSTHPRRWRGSADR